MSGWARWRLCFSSGCFGAWPASAAKPCWLVSHWRFSSTECSSRAVAMVMLGIPCPGPAYSPAAHALSPPDLFLHDAGRRMPHGQIPAQGQPVALGCVSPGDQCGDVHLAAAAVQRQRASGTARTPTANPWLQAFAWIRQNTPTDAYFALDPEYLAAPGEDYHSFRALAERSQLADAIKDTAVVTQVPELGPGVGAAGSGAGRLDPLSACRLPAAEDGLWRKLGAGSYPQPAGLDCRGITTAWLSAGYRKSRD